MNISQSKRLSSLRKSKSENYKKKMGVLHPQIKIIGRYISVNKPVKLKCKVCNNLWKAKPSNSISNRKVGCKKCSTAIGIEKRREKIYSKKAHKIETFRKEIKERFGSHIKVKNKNWKGLNKIAIFYCNKHKFTWKDIPKWTRMKLHCCRVCYLENEHKKHKEKFEENMRLYYPKITLLGKYKSCCEKVLMKCLICNNKWKGSPILYGRGKLKYGCRICATRITANSIGKRRKLYKYKNKMYKLLGYEPFALNYIFRILKYKKKDIKHGKEVPVIDYIDCGKNRKHQADFYIEKENRLIEVKSLYTAGLCNNTNLWFNTLKSKRKYAIKQGYKYSVLIFGSDGKRINLPKNWWKIDPYTISSFIK